MASHQINFPQTTIAGGDRVSGGTIFPLLNVGFARINTIFYRFTCTAAVGDQPDQLTSFYFRITDSGPNITYIQDEFFTLPLPGTNLNSVIYANQYVSGPKPYQVNSQIFNWGASPPIVTMTAATWIPANLLVPPSGNIVISANGALFNVVLTVFTTDA